MHIINRILRRNLKVGYFGPFNPRHDRSRVIIKEECIKLLGMN